MTSVKIIGLTHANVDALATCADLGSELDGSAFGIYLTATTATFVGGASEALTASLAVTWLDGAMKQLPSRGHPRASLHAVRRKLVALVPASQSLHATMRHRDEVVEIAYVTDGEGRTINAYSGEEVEL